MKLWDKGISVHKAIEAFTVGKDRELDLYLAPYDIAGSLAHIRMLESIGLLTHDEWEGMDKELKVLYQKALKSEIVIDEGIEDIHSQIEFLLTQKLGDTGKKIHSGRSRNDQVLLDLKLFIRDAVREVVEHTSVLIDTLLDKSSHFKDVLMPGYTHLQIAMPSSFGLWFGLMPKVLSTTCFC